MRRQHRRYAATAALLLALGACAGDGDVPERTASPTSSPTSSQATPTEPVAPGDPITAKASIHLLDWTQVDLGKEVTVVTDRELTAVVARGGGSVQFSGTRNLTVRAGQGRRITDVLLSSAYAVVVAQDTREERAMSLRVLNTSTGATREIREPLPALGGPVDLNESTLRYATPDGGRYCLATYDIARQSGEVTWCAPKRHGFSNVAASPAGTALMTFDDERPVSCRTLVTVADDGALNPVDGVPACTGWDVLATTDGAIWSILPKEQQVERGAFFARAGDQVYSLGTGVTGSLTWCGDSAYFTRDAQKGGHAQLLRWSPEHTLEIAYESRGRGEAFLEAPRCADSVLTVSAYGEGGDEQVSAPVPR